MQEATQRAQTANQRGCLVSSEEFKTLKEALSRQLGLATPKVNLPFERQSKFLYALGDDEHYLHGADVYSRAQ